MKTLEGVVMELDDGALPLLAGIEATSDLKTAFDGTSLGACSSARSRARRAWSAATCCRSTAGSSSRRARRSTTTRPSDVRVLVVGNPCNTNCLIARSNAPDVPADRWFAMTRLDENRAKSQLAKKAGVHHADVTNMTIWGNHSATQFPDFANAKIGGKPATDVITDQRLAADHVHRDGAEARRRDHRGARRCRRRRRPRTRPSTRSNSVVHTDARRTTGESLAVAATASTACPRACSSASRSQRRPGVVGRRGPHPRRVRAGEDRRHHRGARQRARRGSLARSARELMFASLTFVGDAGDAGVGGPSRAHARRPRAAYLAELVLDVGEMPASIVVRDDDVPLPVARCSRSAADGLWAEMVHEADDHWSFGLEAFGSALRHDRRSAHVRRR